MIHQLKLSNKYFDDVVSGVKNFEVRYNDRNFNVGGILILEEILPSGVKTGRVVRRGVTYLLEGFEGLTPNYVVLGLDDLSSLL